MVHAMDMAYTSNPKLPRLRMQAVLLVRRGWSTRQVARYFGYNQSTIVRWVQRADADNLKGSENLPTLSSRPKSHPRALAPEVVEAIVAARLAHGRCAEVVYEDLLEQGIKVSLSSVKRTLVRHELLKSRSKWKRTRPVVPRPPADAPGVLVQMDTIHFIDWMSRERFYVYVVLDVCSRWAHAEVHDRLSQRLSLAVALRARARAGFGFAMVQTDNGPEYGKWFNDMLAAKGIGLRHSRVRSPNDNAHIERFNRTIQEECLSKYPLRASTTQGRLDAYLSYYNNHRKHMGINFQKPAQVMQRS